MQRARIRSTPAEDLQYRRQEVTVGSKTVVTPAKSIGPKKMSPLVEISEKAAYINELYRRLSDASLGKCISGADRAPVYDLNRAQSMLKESDERVQMCFLEMKTRTIPTKKEIEYATDLAYGYSDITPLPMLSNFVGRVTDMKQDGKKTVRVPNPSKFERVKKYLADTIDTIMQLNTKPIMGHVPDYRLYFDEIAKLYVDRGINTFYFDAHLSNPITLHEALRAFRRELSKHDALEGSFIHMINPGAGRAPKDSPVAPARDVLGFGLGIDSLGERHMQMYMIPSIAEGLRQNPDNRHKLFGKDIYGYLRTSDSARIRSFYPDDSAIAVSEFLGRTAPDRGVQNAFNSEQLALEGARLSGKLGRYEAMLPYIEKKEGVRDEDVKILKRAKVQRG